MNIQSYKNRPRKEVRQCTTTYKNIVFTGTLPSARDLGSKNKFLRRAYQARSFPLHTRQTRGNAKSYFMVVCDLWFIWFIFVAVC